MGISERGTSLKVEMEEVTPIANGDEAVLNEEAVQTAKIKTSLYGDLGSS